MTSSADQQPDVITVLVPYDQLSRQHGALARAHPSTHDVLMVESEQMLRSRRWHVQRLHLVMSAAAHFAEDLRREGFALHMRTAPSVSAGVEAFRRERSGTRIIAAQPTSRPLQSRLDDLGVELVPDDHFLTARADFAKWAQGRRTLLMEDFYRWQRRRLDVLMDAGKPVGGAWNFDADNRLPPPKGPYEWPAPLEFPPDDIDKVTLQRIEELGLDVTGERPSGTWATTRAGALQQLRHFVTINLANFGPYEDAMPAATWSAHHSLLSTYLNIGLISPREVIDAALAEFARGGVPLASIEGFVRQVIGWREYVNGIYWLVNDDYAHRNGLGAHRRLLPLFDTGETRMACVRGVVTDVQSRGWVHHIPRLMILANLALLTGIDPADMLAWMRRTFVDASDWVMVPNVIGMGVHADGGWMMTKPYAAGGAYISRMGQYCKPCEFDPKARTGDRACPFTTLYWDFLDRHRPAFEGNHRMAQQVRGLDRLTDLAEVRLRAQAVLAELDAGCL